MSEPSAPPRPAAVLVAAWTLHGFHVQRPKYADGQLSCVVCDGDTCEMVKTAVSPPTALMTPALARRLLLQPVALLAVGGMALLTFCVAYESAFTDTLLALVGGRQPGALVLTAACAAHVGEAMIAHHNVATRLRAGTGAEQLAWCLLVMLVGFPVLRHVLALKASEGKLHRA
jgi:hypothetical protein